VGSEWSASRSGCALTPAKDPRCPLDRRLGRPKSFCTQSLEEKSFAFAEDRIPVVQNSRQKRQREMKEDSRRKELNKDGMRTNR
jgi:hypothetical protein